MTITFRDQEHFFCENDPDPSIISPRPGQAPGSPRKAGIRFEETPPGRSFSYLEKRWTPISHQISYGELLGHPHPIRFPTVFREVLRF